MTAITNDKELRKQIDDLYKDMPLPKDEIGKLAEDLRPALVALNKKVETALSELKDNSSNPAYLADYQTATSQYNVYRQLASSAIKEKRDLDLAIIRNIG